MTLLQIRLIRTRFGTLPRPACTPARFASFMRAASLVLAAWCTTAAHALPLEERIRELDSAEAKRLEPYLDSENDAVSQRLLSIADRIKEAAGRPDVKIVLLRDNPRIYIASAYESGTIYINKAVVSAYTDDGVAFTFGHELAHIIEHHARSRLLALSAPDQQSGNDPSAEARSQRTWDQMVQENEFQADQIGRDLADRAGFNGLAGATVVMQSIRSGDDEHAAPSERLRRLEHPAP